jgi:glutathione S-transferase
MRILWGRLTSSNVMKVAWLLERLGAPYERREAGGAFGVVDTPAFRAMNPNGLIPVLQEPGGVVLWESNTILRYLAATCAGGETVLPREPLARARVERWMDWERSLVTSMSPLFKALVRGPHPGAEAVAAHRAEAAKGFAILEGALADGRPWLEGGFSLAEVALGPLAHRWSALPIERPAMPALAAWYGRLQEDAAYRRIVAVPLS